MNALPIVTIRPSDGGWGALCSCGWRLWQIRRPVVDLEAHDHRAKCATKARRR